MPTKIIYTPHYTVVGSPTISDEYVASSFSSRNGVAANETLDTSKHWTIFAKIHSSSDTSTRQKFIGCANSADQKVPTLEFRSGKVYACMPNSSGNGWLFEVNTGFTPNTNTDYWFKYGWDGNTYSVEVSTDGENYTSVYTNSSQTAAYHSDAYKVLFGNDLYGGSYQLPFLGTVDLKECYFVVDGVKAWEAVTVTEVETSGTVSVSKGYYDNGSNKIQITSAITKYLDDISSGETIACKNKLFAYSKNGTADIRITTNNDITTSHDVSVELNKNVYLSCLKNYIIGHTPLQKIPMAVGGELTTDYTANDPSSIDSDYILHSTAQGKYVYKNFSESDITTGEITLKCKQTAIKYRSDVISGWALIGFAEGYLGMWDGGNWRTNTYYPVGTWVWVKAVYTPATSNFKIYGLVDNGYTLETLPDISQWTLEYSGQPTGTHFMTQALYLPDAGSEWFQGDIDLKTVQVKKNGVEIWRAVSTPANGVKNSSNGFAYDSTNDKTFWYPSETILTLSGFSSLEDRCNLYLANEAGKDVSRFLAGSTPAAPSVPKYSVVGSPTIDSNYLANGWTTSSYLTTQLPTISSSFEFYAKVQIPSTLSSFNEPATLFSFSGSDASFGPYRDNGSAAIQWSGYLNSSYTFLNNDNIQAGWCWVALVITPSGADTYYLDVINNPNQYTLDTLPPVSDPAWTHKTTSSNTSLLSLISGQIFFFGRYNYRNSGFNGIINMEQLMYKADGTTWRAVEPGATIADYRQQGYVYLNHAHNKVIGVGTEPDDVELDTTGTTITNYTEVGSPTITDDYVASGFSSSNYIQVEALSSYSDFEYTTVVKPTSTSGQNVIESNNRSTSYSMARVRDGYFGIWGPNQGWRSTGDAPATAGSTYWLKCVYDSSTLKLYVTGYTEGVNPPADLSNWTLAGEVTDSSDVSGYGSYFTYETFFGFNKGYGEAFNGSIDLKHTSLKVNGTEVWRAVSQGAQNTVTVSDSHYWTYLGNTSYDVQGQSMASTSMTGSIGSGYMMLNPNGTLAFTDATNAYQYVGGNAFSGYNILFTDNTHTEISNLSNQSATKCRVYARLSGSTYSALYTATVPPTGDIKASVESTDGKLAIAPSAYFPSSSYTYDATNDTISIEGSVYSYIGDFYAII